MYFLLQLVLLNAMDWVSIERSVLDSTLSSIRDKSNISSQGVIPLPAPGQIERVKSETNCDPSNTEELGTSSAGVCFGDRLGWLEEKLQYVDMRLQDCEANCKCGDATMRLVRLEEESEKHRVTLTDLSRTVRDISENFGLLVSRVKKFECQFEDSCSGYVTTRSFEEYCRDIFADIHSLKKTTSVNASLYQQFEELRLFLLNSLSDIGLETNRDECPFISNRYCINFVILTRNIFFNV